MAVDFNYRKAAVRALTNRIGVYVLADLENVPIYVGQSKDGIRARVSRHLTSARSDIIANRQIDVWEIAYVWAYPVEDKSEINDLEAILFHHFDPVSQLMNGTLPRSPAVLPDLPTPAQVVQVMSDDEINDRKQPEQRLPRQANHYAEIVDHFLTVKNSSQIARAMNAHFERLKRYHALLLGKAETDPADKDDG
ncbi:GIY-YIG nuclease family protein [Agrobacterium rosae]|uniref:GIY-YIG nuclease family protein n=1 Tax=Agrobacterium rosae TaxID=1972867 RepID=UPI003A804915